MKFPQKRQSPEHYKNILAIRIRNTNKRFAGHFWERVEKTDYCWNWLGSKKPSGHGKVCHFGKLWQAHRAAWTLANGDIPAGLWVLHKCDNPCCVNPEHLYLGTHSDNTRDAVERNRFLSGSRSPMFGRWGEQNPASKYTNDRRKQIIEMRDSGMGFSEIARTLSMPVSTARGIYTRCRKWIC